MNLNIVDELQSITVIILIDAQLSCCLSMGASNWHLGSFDMTLVVLTNFLTFGYDRISKIILYISPFRLGIFYFPKESWFLLVTSGI